MRLPNSRLLASLTLCAILLAAAGCGGDEAPKGKKGQVRESMEQFAESDPALCGRLTERFLQQTFGGTKADCERQVGQIETVELEIESIKIKDTRADVRAEISGEPVRALLVREGDTWKLDRVEEAPAEPAR